MESPPGCRQPDWRERSRCHVRYEQTGRHWPRRRGARAHGSAASWSQWGTESHSTNPRRIEQITGFAEDGGLWIAEAENADPNAPGSSADAQRSGVQVVGALAVGDALSYVPAATEPELYVRLLVTDRRLVGQGIGTQLLDHARLLARAAGAGLLRLDCFAGSDGALIRYYEKQGFTRAEQFAVPVNDSEWLGQVLIQRL